MERESVLVKLYRSKRIDQVPRLTHCFDIKRREAVETTSISWKPARFFPMPAGSPVLVDTYCTIF